MQFAIPKNTIKEFFNFLIPSVIGCISIAALIIIDGIFIGRGIGGNGLAALSTSVPMFNFYTGIGLMIGMGGATVASIQKGQNDTNGRRKTFTLSLVLSLIVGLTLTGLQVLFIDNIASFLGAPDNIFSFVKDYISVISLFTTFYLAGQFLSCFLRNDNNPQLSMIAMVISGIINIIFDYLFIFVFEWGMTGAAIATCISQVSFVATLLFHFISSKNTLKLDFKCFDMNNTFRILKTGFPTFLSDVSNGIVIFAFNITLYKIVGELGVASYGIIMNFNYLIYLTYIGISQAAQPMISISYGRNDIKKVIDTLKLALIFSLTVSVVTLISVNVFTHNIIGAYNNEPSIVKMAAKGMPIFFTGTIFMGINSILAAFFQAVEYSTLSSLITFSKGIVFILLGLFLLPLFLGLNGVWAVILFAEGITFVLFIIFFLVKKIKL